MVLQSDCDFSVKVCLLFNSLFCPHVDFFKIKSWAGFSSWYEQKFSIWCDLADDVLNGIR